MMAHLKERVEKGAMLMLFCKKQSMQLPWGSRIYRRKIIEIKEQRPRNVKMGKSVMVLYLPP